MLDPTLFIALGLAILLLFADYVYRNFIRKSKIGIEGKLIWTDHGKNTKSFFNPVFKVFGKPDLMYAVRGGVLAVEYKSRHGTIYESDIVQAMCAALAARGDGYNVIKILLKTSTQERYVSLPKKDKDLYSEIKGFVSIARRAKNGECLPGAPEEKKCSSCAYKHDCRYTHR